MRIMKNKIAIVVILLLSMLLFFGFTADSVDKEKENKKLSKTYSNDASIGDSYNMFINKIAMPMNSRGKIADVVVGDELAGGRIDGKVFLFSGGFMMSGVNDQGIMWANGYASASRVEDYEPGTASWDAAEDKQVTDDTYAGMYLVRASDEPFGSSWP